MTQEQELKEAKELLKRLLDWALAGRNTPYEFVRCYTYERKYGKNSIPECISDAKQFLGESVTHFHIKVDRC